MSASGEEIGLPDPALPTRGNDSDAERIASLLLGRGTGDDADLARSEATQDLARAIRTQHKPCRASIYLRCIQTSPSAPDDPKDISKALAYALRSYSIHEALVQLTDPTSLQRLYQSVGGTTQFDELALDQETLAAALLDHLRIAWRVELGTPRLRTPQEALEDIRDIERAIRNKRRPDMFTLLSCHGANLSAWGVVESVLKLTLGFVALHLRDTLPPKLVQFEEWTIGRRSGKQVIHACEEIEYYFVHGETRGETRKRRRQYTKELCRTSKDRRRQTRRAQQERESRLLIPRQQTAKKLQNDWYRDFHRYSPFAAVPTQVYGEWYDLERNQAAHSPIQDLLKTGDEKDILQPLRMAREIIRDLSDRQVVPRVITLLGEGRDMHGSTILWFTDASTFNGAKTRSVSMEWMYAITHAQQPMLQPLVMLPPAPVSNALDEPLIEPVIYSLAEVQGLVEKGEYRE